MKTKTQHTPTPWTRGVCNEIRQGTATVGNAFKMARSIATCYPTNGTKEELDEVFANASFIVRAVNSHEALISIRNAVIEWAKTPGPHGINPYMLDFVRKAVIHAEGE